MDRLTFTPQVKSLDDEAGVAEFYFSMFDNIDLGGDVVHKGFFSHVIDTTPALRVPFVADHSTSVKDRLGVVTGLGEDDRGAYAQVEFGLHRQIAKDVYEDFKRWPEAMEFSFAFDLFERPKGFDYGADGIRHLYLARGLYDVSNVTKGMNPATELVGVKADEGKDGFLDESSSLAMKRRRIDIALAKQRLS